MIFNQNTLCFLCDILTHFDELDLGTPFASKINVNFICGRGLQPNTFPSIASKMQFYTILNFSSSSLQKNK